MLGEYSLGLRALQVRECRHITEASLASLRARKVRIDKAAPFVPGTQHHECREARYPLNIQI